LLWLALFKGTTWRLAALGLAASLSDAAAVNIGFSINVNWAMALVIIGWFAIQIHTSPPPTYLAARAVNRVLPVIIFWFWNAALIMFAPYVFSYIGETMPGSSNFDPRLSVPLASQGESFNQQVYLLVCIVLTCVIAVTLAREPQHMMRRINYLITGLFVGAAFWVYWHIASIRLGVPFPGALLHNDPHSFAWNQYLGGIQRPSGSMPEPSSVAGFFLPFPFYYFEYYLATKRRAWLLAIFVALGALFFSTSSTAFAGIAMFVTWVAVRGLGGVAAFATGGRILVRDLKAFAAFCALTVVGAVAVWVFLIDPDVAQTIIREQILEKSTSISGRQRGYANDLAFDIFLQTYGVGVGMGNHRASSIVLALLSGTGVIGFALMAYFFFEIAWRAMLRGRLVNRIYARKSFALVTGFGGIIAGSILVGGELQSVIMWAWVGCLIALNIAPLPAARPARAPVREAPQAPLAQLPQAGE
jgi:hypothetical protein